MENKAFDSVELAQDSARQSKRDSVAPNVEDFNWSAYFCLFIIGIGSLLPWNFFITPELYWQVFEKEYLYHKKYGNMFGRKNLKIQNHLMI